MPVIDLSDDGEPQPGGSGAGGGSQQNKRRASKTPADSDVDPEETDEDDFVDASDMMDDDDFVSVAGAGKTGPYRSQGSRLQSLLPDDYGSDETTAAIKFSEEFVNRYGRPHPEFFPGSLDEAIKQSCLKPAREVRASGLEFDLF